MDTNTIQDGVRKGGGGQKAPHLPALQVFSPQLLET